MNMFPQYKKNLLFIQTDVSNEEQVQNMVNKTIQEFKQIDCLINNAAIANPYSTPVEDMKLSEWNKIINTNLTSVFLCCKYTIPYLKKTKGCIINIASTRALMSEKNSEAYCASKGI